MAARLVVDAILNSAVTFLIDKLSSSVFRRLFQRKKLNKRLIDELETTLKAAQAVLNYAETKQIKDEAVKNWLSNLEHAVYVADDLLDQVSTRAEIQKLAGNSNDVNFQEEEIVGKMEEIIETVKSIVQQKKDLGLEAILEAIPEEDKSWRVTTSLLVQTSAIYGRDQDKEAIIAMLLHDTRYGELSVISIVGMGGIGKTTLAQLAFNDERVVKGKFDYTKWVCVGEKIDVFSVSKTILEAVTKKPWGLNDLDSLQVELKKELTGKTFLIVLDDVWFVRSDEWNTFLKPFHDGNKGSKLMLTTRNENVASLLPTTTRTIPPYKLSSLSDEHCWLVFLKHSLLSTEREEYATLEPIGREIVKRCKGLPLAVETLGGLLHSKYDVKDWETVLKSEFWEFSEDKSRILPALRISYHYLPSHLKRCFVFCSLFPQDYPFDKDELILLWMAEDFVRPMGGKSPEEVGSAYFHELVARSFFQPRPSFFRDRFVMHDLMHELATRCAGEFYFGNKELGNQIEIGGKTRHLSFIVKVKEDFFKLTDLCRAEHTRTIIVHSNWLGHNFIEDARSRSHLKSLRVLSFNSIQLDTLHPSIGELIHMRYLDLSNTYIVTLPESLSMLFNLQTLKLINCRKLKRLPSGMQDLVNLRHLDIEQTHSLEEMPKGMSQMKHLQFLSDYIVGKEEGNKIGELGELVNLHGSLCISEIENVGNVNEALEAKMIDKKYINCLELIWSSDSNVVDDSHIIERDILDKLQPHQGLKNLSVDGYRGTRFPDWLGHSSYKHMTHLTLHGSEHCCKLPSVGQLPSLKHLEISRFDRLVCIGAEFFRGDDSCCETPPFPSLQTLIFDGLKCWEEWHSFESEDAFPQLKELTITICPRLKGNLPAHLPKLENLNIDTECKQLACLLPKTPAMLELQIRFTNRLRMQELPPSMRSIRIKGSELIESVLEAMGRTQPTCLWSLYIQDCDSAISFPGDCIPASLKLLEIRNCKKLDFPTQQQQQHHSLHELKIDFSCDSLTSFPLSAFPNIRELEICDCENMESLEVSQSHNASNSSLRSLSISACPNFVSLSTLWMAAPQLESLSISYCPEIESFGDDEGGLPPNLRELVIFDCEKLVSRLASMDLRSHGLTRLYISGASESVKCFPKEGCLPASLESLSLWSFPSLETLDCNGLSHLTSLHSLQISDCEKLENMTGQTLPASLTLLHIVGCPLGERCKVKDPQIWPIISHIRKIEVNWVQINDITSSTGF